MPAIRTTPLTPCVRCLFLTTVLVLLSVSGAIAGDTSPIGPPVHPPATSDVLTLAEAADLLRITPDELRMLAEQRGIPGRRIDERWRFHRAALLSWLEGTARSTSTSLRDTELEDIVGRGPNDDASAAASIGEERQYKTAEEVFLRDHRVLLGRRQMVIEPSVFYSKVDNRILTVEDIELTSSSGQTVVVVIHNLDQIEQHTTDAFLTLRYGLFEETEIFSGLRFRHRQTLSDRSGSDRFSEIRHLNVGVRKTVLREGRFMPDVVLSAEGRIPFGENSGAVEAQAWLIKSFDPIVLLGGVGYRRTFVPDTASVTRVEPANLVDLTMGYAFAVNDELTLHTRLIARFEGRTEYSNVLLESDQDFNLQLGLTGKAGRGPFVEPTVTFGLDGPGARVMFGLSLPFLVNF